MVLPAEREKASPLSAGKGLGLRPFPSPIPAGRINEMGFKAVSEIVGIEFVSREGFNNNDDARCHNKI